MRSRNVNLIQILFISVLSFHQGTMGEFKLELEDKDFEEDLEDSAEATWWNRDWKIRRQIKLDGAGLLLSDDGFVFFTEPDPLLLYNTGRTRKRLADLRAVTWSGDELPCGVFDFGQDDGHSSLWVKPGKLLSGTKLRFHLYYGNPKAGKSKLKLPKDVEPPDEPNVRVEMGTEEYLDGKRPFTEVPFAKLLSESVTVEAEFTHDEQGRAVVKNRKLSSPSFWQIPHGAASAGVYLAAYKPWQQRDLKEPVTAWTETELPSGGEWQVHVRYKISRYQMKGRPRKLTRTIEFIPFNLLLGDKRIECGHDQRPGAQFRWQSFSAQLPAGKLKVGFELRGTSGPDVVLFCKKTEYLPDVHDFTGPVWMRFKVLSGTDKPFSVEMFCVTQPWSSHGPAGRPAAFLFKNQVIEHLEEALPLCKKEEHLLKAGEWTPWAKAAHSSMATWWSHIRFHSIDLGILRNGMANLEVAFQFASRGTTDRIFREGVENTEAVQGLNILMPTGLDAHKMLHDTLSFGQWAKRRYQMVQSLGLDGTGPRPDKIFVCTMGTSKSSMETEYIVRQCGLLGFNGLELRTPMSASRFDRLKQKYGMRSTAQHHWYPKRPLEVFERIGRPKREGETFADVVRRGLKESADLCYSPQGRRWHADSAQVELIIMGDEIGPATSPPYINSIPNLLGWYQEYLKEKGVNPAQLGKKDWPEVKAFEDAPVRFGSESYRTLIQVDPSRVQEVAPDAPKSLAEFDPEADDDPELEDLRAADEEDARQAAARLETFDLTALTLEQKRHRYWTKRFQSFYSTEFYGACGEAIRKVTKEGHFRRKPFASPNFQAMPVQRSQMWTGALNLFEWARSNTTDFLMLEDWNWDCYRIAFGAEILRAAARKRGQIIGALTVGGSIQQRFLANLGNGARSIFSYLYGPLRVIGPPWAEHEETNRDWAETLRWVGRCEKDILASRSRPSPVGILVANSSEINTAYINPVFNRYPLYQRAAMYVALKDSGLPVEVVGEEEIIEDEALTRYRVLYAADTHVSLKAQEKIKEWVRKGGVLWSPYNALAREEFDQKTDTFNEVFGVKNRPPLKPSEFTWTPEQEVEIRVSENAAGQRHLSAVTFKSVPCQPRYELTTGNGMAHFQDASPALIQNRYGKGQAFLYGSTVRPLTGGYHRRVDEPENAAKTRKLLTIGCAAAGIEQQIKLSRPRVMSFIHDGPKQTVLFLVNCFEKSQNDVKVELQLPMPAKSAYSGRLENFPFERTAQGVTFNIDLSFHGGEIIVFRQ